MISGNLSFHGADTDANEPQSTIVRNNVVEGYGRTIPASFGIGQGMGHDNLYTHNDVYDGYHCAISTSQGIADTTVPAGIGNANNVVSFNQVYNLLQGIMNDGGSIRIDGGNAVFTAAGNKIVNNKIHDVSDTSALDPNGYGGNGVYLDDDTASPPLLFVIKNNLFYFDHTNKSTPRFWVQGGCLYSGGISLYEIPAVGREHVLAD